MRTKRIEDQYRPNSEVNKLFIKWLIEPKNGIFVSYVSLSITKSIRRMLSFILCWLVNGLNSTIIVTFHFLVKLD